jgi:hypothetical protein
MKKIKEIKINTDNAELFNDFGTEKFLLTSPKNSLLVKATKVGENMKL